MQSELITIVLAVKVERPFIFLGPKFLANVFNY